MLTKRDDGTPATLVTLSGHPYWQQYGLNCRVLLPTSQWGWYPTCKLSYYVLVVCIEQVTPPSCHSEKEEKKLLEKDFISKTDKTFFLNVISHRKAHIFSPPPTRYFSTSAIQTSQWCDIPYIYPYYDDTRFCILKCIFKIGHLISFS